MTAAAVCVSCRVPAHGHKTLELALAWDMPCVRFGSKEKLHLRWVSCHQWCLAHAPKAPFSLLLDLCTMWGLFGTQSLWLWPCQLREGTLCPVPAPQCP